MSGFGIEVEGAARLRSTLDSAAADLDVPQPANADAAQIVARAARLGAPRRRGWLAATVEAQDGPHELAVVAGGGKVDYARPVHAVNPFITTAYRSTEAEVEAAYTQYVEDTFDQIKGT